MTPREGQACDEVYGDMERTSIENNRIIAAMNLRYDLLLASRMNRSD